MIDPRIREILGPTGSEALAEAQRTISAAHSDARALTLTWAGWTPEEWNFTFLEREPARRFTVHVPHGGGNITVRLLDASDRPGTGPLGG